MKKLLWPVVMVSLIVLYSSCAKDVAEKPSAIDCSTIDPSINTYTLNIKKIIDGNCATVNCHDAVFHTASGISLATYAEVKAEFEKGTVMGSVTHSPGFIAMPQNSPKLADSLITYMQCWADNNYPQ